MKRRTTTLIILILSLALLLFSGCGALSKQRSTLPLDESWEGPSGKVGDVRIILEPEVRCQIALEERDPLWRDQPDVGRYSLIEIESRAQRPSLWSIHTMLPHR